MFYFSDVFQQYDFLNLSMADDSEKTVGYSIDKEAEALLFGEPYSSNLTDDFQTEDLEGVGGGDEDPQELLQKLASGGCQVRMGHS